MSPELLLSLQPQEVTVLHQLISAVWSTAGLVESSSDCTTGWVLLLCCPWLLSYGSCQAGSLPSRWQLIRLMYTAIVGIAVFAVSKETPAR
jgi:hypothetical protein